MKKNKIPSHRNSIIILSVAIAILLGYIMYSAFTQTSKDNLGDCKAFNNNRICTGIFLDLQIKDAEELAHEKGLESRVVRENGKTYPMTADGQTNRINFTIWDNKVVKAEYDN